MARKPNYEFEKRQKELARKQKQEAKAEAKRLRKLEGSENVDAGPGLTPDDLGAQDGATDIK